MSITEIDCHLDQMPDAGTGKETLIDPGKVAITTITYYPDWYAGEPKDLADEGKIRGDCFFELAQAARDADYLLVVANSRDSSPAFKQALADLEGVVVVNRPVSDRVTGSLLAIEAAVELGAEIFFYTQPEKADIIPFVAELVEPFKDPEVIVVKGHRTRESCDSYPRYMRNSENLGSFMVNYMLHQAGIIPQEENMEWFFGVTVFRNCSEIMEIMRTVYAFKEEGRLLEAEDLAASYGYAGIGVSIIPAIAALAKGLKVVEVPVDFQYPPAQRANEEAPGAIEGFKVKRRQQRLSICARIWNFLSYLKQQSSLLVPLTLDVKLIQLLGKDSSSQ